MPTLLGSNKKLKGHSTDCG